MTRDPDRGFFGHPIGLSTLFFTEMWERFSYYGTRTILVIYMITHLEDGGRGMSIGAAGVVYALYTASVYMLSLPGGWIADRFLGQRSAVMWGGIGIALGNAMLTIPMDGMFYPALAVIALGTGLLKPNVSTIVGQLYSQEDIRRDAGFTIYYMGINIGAAVAPLAVGFVAQSDSFRAFLDHVGVDPNLCWHLAFGAAAVGMIAGVIQFRAGARRLGDAGAHPTVPSDPVKAARDRQVLGVLIGSIVAIAIATTVLVVMNVSVTKATIANVFGAGLVVTALGLFYGLLRTARDRSERQRVIAMIPLFIGAVAFFAAFEQASSTMSVIAERAVHREYLGIHIPASYYQVINAGFILILAGVFAWIWLRLAKAGKEPSSVNKFAIGIIFTAISFMVLVPVLGPIDTITNGDATIGKLPLVGDMIDHVYEPTRISGNWLMVLYFFATISELCISPVGLSSMSKLAPKRMAGMVMGTWFLATAMGDYLAGRATELAEDRGFGFLFWTFIISTLVVAAALFAIAPVIKKMMAGGASSEPLPKAVALETKPAQEAP